MDNINDRENLNSSERLEEALVYGGCPHMAKEPLRQGVQWHERHDAHDAL